MIGAYTAGVLGGRTSKRLLLSGIYFSARVAFLLFVAAPDLAAHACCCSARRSACCGCRPSRSRPGLVALMFGTRHVGMLFGFVFLCHQVGAFVGVWLGGAVYEATGAYDAMWWLSIALEPRRGRSCTCRSTSGAPRAGAGAGMSLWRDLAVGARGHRARRRGRLLAGRAHRGLRAPGRHGRDAPARLPAPLTP